MCLTPSRVHRWCVQHQSHPWEVFLTHNRRYHLFGSPMRIAEELESRCKVDNVHVSNLVPIHP